jgi:hypothetical protein
MGTRKKRLDKAEGSLTPAEVVAIWTKELPKFDSLQEYVFWMVEDSRRSPLGRMLPQIKKDIPRGSGRLGRDESRELLRKRSSEVVFLYRLLMGVNERVCRFLDREKFRIAELTANLRTINERVLSAIDIFELRKELAITLFARAACGVN